MNVRTPRMFVAKESPRWIDALAESLCDSHYTSLRSTGIGTSGQNFIACILAWLANGVSGSTPPTPTHLYRFMAVRSQKILDAITENSLQLSLINGNVILVNGEMFDLVSTAAVTVCKDEIRDVATMNFNFGDYLTVQ